MRIHVHLNITKQNTKKMQQLQKQTLQSMKRGNSLTRLKCETKTDTKQNCVKVNETYVEDNKRAKDIRIRKQKMILVQL